MKTQKLLFTPALVLASLIALPAARADELDQADKLTFSQAVQIPGHVLPAGTYWFVLANINSRDAVQVFNSDRSVLYGTMWTIPAERAKSTDKTAITFAEPAMQPATLLVWFYPESSTGHQFLYPKPEEHELARAKHQTAIAG